VTQGAGLIEISQKTLRRRAHELARSAQDVDDAYSRALLLFYAAECGLKAVYMAVNVLKTTGASHSAPAAASFSHRLDDLIIALRIPASSLLPRPSPVHLRAPPNTTVAVGELNQIWRYGESVVQPNDCVDWLERVVAYVTKELR
jgi:hypothetical protein